MKRSGGPKGGTKGQATKGQAKVQEERRKKPRNPRKTGARAGRAAQKAVAACFNCGKNLAGDDQQALFVEEDVNRIFCTEVCITEYFAPEIQALEREYLKNVSQNDFSIAERESLGHLRWITLQEPDEVWVTETPAGDKRFTLISKFQPGNQPLWFVCITLFLRGEPSFLYLAFPTRDALLADFYRRGERVNWERGTQTAHVLHADEVPAETASDRLASAWTDDETAMAHRPTYERENDDIPEADYPKYQQQLDQTLEEPTELWSQPIGEGSERHIYHFIRHFPEIDDGIWAVIVARELETEGQIEILDAFPTRHSAHVDKFRVGEREMITMMETPPSRVVH